MILNKDKSVGYRDNYGTTIFPRISFEFFNYGRTPAIIREFSIRLDLHPRPELMQSRQVLGGFIDNVIRENTATVPEYVKASSSFSAADRERISLEQDFIWINGWIKYDDVFGSSWRRKFLFQYAYDLDRFVEPFDRKYNFELQEPQIGPGRSTFTVRLRSWLNHNTKGSSQSPTMQSQPDSASQSLDIW